MGQSTLAREGRRPVRQRGEGVKRLTPNNAGNEARLTRAAVQLISAVAMRLDPLA
jgi:hypothetical protein